jgi:hypothetical protein
LLNGESPVGRQEIGKRICILSIDGRDDRFNELFDEVWERLIPVQKQGIPPSKASPF